MTAPTTVICVADDRADEAVAVKLLIASLAEHCPDLPVTVWFPPATEGFARWAARLPHVTLRTETIPGATGWNKKPHALLLLLEGGADELWWIDSDVILTSDFRAALPPLRRETLVVAQEALYGRPGDGGIRAAGWGLGAARILDEAVNTSVLRVTSAHLELLTEWKLMLHRPEYVAAQADPWYDRPTHFVGDQDVLTALLSSRRFAGVPLAWLRRGREIIQYFGPSGYTTRERLCNLTHGTPAFVHEQGGNKPWHRRSRRPGARGVVDELLVEASPYTLYAEHYRDVIQAEAAETDWMDNRTFAGRLLRAAGLGSAPLTGLPLALAYGIRSALSPASRAGADGGPPLTPVAPP
jgi:hypothetical protein